VGHGEEADVIAREWRGWTRAEDGHHYDEHYHNEATRGRTVRGIGYIFDLTD